MVWMMEENSIAAGFSCIRYLGSPCHYSTSYSKWPEIPAPCTPHYLRSAVDLCRRRSSSIFVGFLIVRWFCLKIEFRLPHPNECQLYYVNRDTLFSYHKASEVFLQVIFNVFLLYQPFFGGKCVSIYRTLCGLWETVHFIVNFVQWVVVFHAVWWLFMYTFMLYKTGTYGLWWLQRMMALYVASHYKNTPNDLQLMSDAPAHHLFVLLGKLIFISCSWRGTFL